MSKHWLAQQSRMIIATKAGIPQMIAVRDLRFPLDTLGFLINGSGLDGSKFTLVAS
jgi:hypothetical protein